MYKRVSGIYKIQSKIKPARIYIGSSVDIRKRWREHQLALLKNQYKHSRLQNHYNKYGKGDLVFSIVTECDKDKLIEHEQFFIDALNPWFNFVKIAGRPPCQAGDKNPFWGKKHTEETKQKIREARLGTHFAPEVIEEFKRTRRGRKGWAHTPESREKISKANKGHEAWNKGMKFPYKPRGKHKKTIDGILPSEREKFTHSLESRRKMSIARTGKKQSEETKQKRVKNRLNTIRNKKIGDILFGLLNKVA